MPLPIELTPLCCLHEVQGLLSQLLQLVVGRGIPETFLSFLFHSIFPLIFWGFLAIPDVTKVRFVQGKLLLRFEVEKNVEQLRHGLGILSLPRGFPSSSNQICSVLCIYKTHIFLLGKLISPFFLW